MMTIRKSQSLTVTATLTPSPLGGLYILLIHIVYTVSWMAKKIKAFRFHPDVYMRFRELASTGGYTVTGAFEKFMRTCIECEQLVFPEPIKAEDAEAEARIMLAWLRKDRYRYSFRGQEVSVAGRLLQLLPKVHDASLKMEIEEELKKH